MTRTSYQNAQSAALELLAYCRSNDWAGYDPYDALNSSLFKALPFLNSRIPRLVLTQILKRSPVNLRSFLQIPKVQNPKALALFLSSLIKLHKLGIENQQEVEDLIVFMIQRLRAMRSPGVPYWCWGYSFPWQTRTVLVPSGAPNLVCTSFVANALLDVWEHERDSRCLDMAVSAAEYVLNELYWTDDGVGFSYPLPSLRSRVHNANFMAAALLCRVFSHTAEKKFCFPALKVARYSITMQRPDGSWPYGEGPTQRWIDNFHTGYNLCALQEIGRFAVTTEFDLALRHGFEYYRRHFFLPDGAVRYFHDRTYPVDVHCVAQSMITLLKLRQLNADNLALAHFVLRWALTHLWDDRGFFYYRVLRCHTNRISFIRWSQAWMLLAMVMLLEASGSDGADEKDRGVEEVFRSAHD